MKRAESPSELPKPCGNPLCFSCAERRRAEVVTAKDYVRLEFEKQERALSERLRKRRIS